MVRSVEVQALELLRRCGWTPLDVLGQGMEGTVVDLSAGMVAKIWHRRSRADVTPLLEFGHALDAASLPFATPQVVDLLDDDDLVVTIERKIVGDALRVDGLREPRVVTAQEVRLVGDVLEGLAHATLSPGLTALPILPGESETEPPPAPFPHSLAGLAERRFHALPDLLRREVEDVDDLVVAVLAGLRALPTIVHPGLIHGDLIPANVYVHDGRVTGVLDFGFMTTVGDPQFDAAIAASIFDMYGANAAASEIILTDAFLVRFRHDAKRYALYRAAYAIITNAFFGTDGTDGHFAWCAQMLRRADIREAVLS